MTTGLDTRTGARTITLDGLVNLAWTGQIRVPHFQRDFKWTRRDVVALLDSIRRGYPVGSLLLWQRKADAGDVTLGALSIAAPSSDAALWARAFQERLV